jgi:HlyD family secretion protein
LDKPLRKRLWNKSRVLSIVLVWAGIASLTYLFASRSGKARLRVDPTRITFSKIGYGEFREYYPFDAKVEPVISVYLDVETGGRVDEIFAEGGKFVKKGDLILKFSNSSLQRNSIDTESRLIDALDAQRNTQFTRAQNKLANRDTLLGIDFQIYSLGQKHKRYQTLAKEGLIPIQDFEGVRDELQYTIDKKALLQERIRQEDLLSEKQLEQAKLSIERLNLSRELLVKTVESLEVRTPISGYLSSIEAEVGQNITAGKRIGQIDLLDKLKLSAGIDQYYIAKVAVGTKGTFSLEGASYLVAVQKIYPEVKENKFTVDMGFTGEVPKEIKRGQTVTIELDFSESEKSLVVAKGGFYNQTKGRWAYLLSEDHRSASRTNIRTGRQNPHDVEVLEGLREADWIITSGYDSFNDADTLAFSQPIQLK